MARMTKARLIAELTAKGIEFDENAKYNDLWKLLKNPPLKDSDVMPDLPMVEDKRLTHKNIGNPITAMLISTAETVGLTQGEILACKDKEELVAAIANMNGKEIPAEQELDIISNPIPVEPVEVAEPQILEPEPETVPDELIKRAKKIGFSNEQIATYIDPEKLKMACDRVKPQATAYTPPPKRQIYKPFPDKPKGKRTQTEFTTEISVKRAQAVRRCDYDNMILGDFLRKERIRPENVQKVIITRDYVPDKKDILTSRIVVVYLKKA